MLNSVLRLGGKPANVESMSFLNAAQDPKDLSVNGHCLIFCGIKYQKEGDFIELLILRLLEFELLLLNIMTNVIYFQGIRSEKVYF